MNESTCSNSAVGAAPTAEMDKRQGTSPGCLNEPARVPTHAPRQLMCSQDKGEIEAIREVLNSAGIETEIRNNATAAALGVTGIELWVTRGLDYARASAVTTNLQARFRGSAFNFTSTSLTEAGKAGASAPAAVSPEMLEFSKLQEDTSSLEKQIAEMLEFQKEVVNQCLSVSGKTKALGQALTGTRAAFERENENRSTAQKKHAEETTAMQALLQKERLAQQKQCVELESERAKREAAEQELANERRRWGQQAETDQEALKKHQDKLDLQARLLQTHSAAVLKLTKEMAALESQRERDCHTLLQLREELARERKQRLAAEQRAQAAEEQSSLKLPSLLFRRMSGKKTAAN